MAAECGLLPIINWFLKILTNKETMDTKVSDPIVIVIYSKFNQIQYTGHTNHWIQNESSITE
jgi:hypothetical protein